MDFYCLLGIFMRYFLTSVLFHGASERCGSVHPCVEHILLRVHSLEMLEGSVFCVCA